MSNLCPTMNQNNPNQRDRNPHNQADELTVQRAVDT